MISASIRDSSMHNQMYIQSYNNLITNFLSPYVVVSGLFHLLLHVQSVVYYCLEMKVRRSEIRCFCLTKFHEHILQYGYLHASNKVQFRELIQWDGMMG